MNNALQLGPLLLPFSLLLVFASAGTTLALGRRFGRPVGAEVEGLLWQALLVGVVAARLGFVWQFRAAYQAAPLDIIDIRDGGWHAGAGLACAWLYVLGRVRQRPELRKPLLGALLIGTLVFVAGSTALAVRQGSGKPLPPLSFTSVDGQEVQLDQFAGKPVVVNLWATWCPPCVREMPVLRQAQIDRPDVHFVFLNQGESVERVRGWLARRDLGLQNVLIDPQGRASAAFNQQGYPTTLFFGADGRLKSTRVGELSAATLAERLNGAAR